MEVAGTQWGYVPPCHFSKCVPYVYFGEEETLVDFSSWETHDLSCSFQVSNGSFWVMLQRTSFHLFLHSSFSFPTQESGLLLLLLLLNALSLPVHHLLFHSFLILISRAALLSNSTRRRPRRGTYFWFSATPGWDRSTFRLWNGFELDPLICSGKYLVFPIRQTKLNSDPSTFVYDTNHTGRQAGRQANNPKKKERPNKSVCTLGLPGLAGRVAAAAGNHIGRRPTMSWKLKRWKGMKKFGCRVLATGEEPY